MLDDVVKVFIGFDEVESAAWHTLVSSIYSKASSPVAFIPIRNENFNSFFSRERDERQSNTFSFSRFLVPYLMGYRGRAIYMDCDMLMRVDINELIDSAKLTEDIALSVVKHDYEPKDDIKYLGTKQFSYPRKNWSSLIVWNCGHPSNVTVTPEFVSTASPQELHRFSWLKDEQIGELGLEWNWLVGEYEISEKIAVKNIHWTVGGPYFKEYRETDFSEEWHDQYGAMTFVKQLLTEDS